MEIPFGSVQNTLSRPRSRCSPKSSRNQNFDKASRKYTYVIDGFRHRKILGKGCLQLLTKSCLDTDGVGSTLQLLRALIVAAWGMFGLSARVEPGPAAEVTRIFHLEITVKSWCRVVDSSEPKNYISLPPFRNRGLGPTATLQTCLLSANPHHPVPRKHQQSIPALSTKGLPSGPVALEPNPKD